MLSIEKTYTDWRDEMASVEAALAVLLPTLKKPHLSVPLAAQLTPLTGLPEARIRKILGWIAKAGHPNVSHDGGKVRVYGRDAVLWRWHPLPIVPVDGLEARLNAAGVVDTSEW